MQKIFESGWFPRILDNTRKMQLLHLFLKGLKKWKYSLHRYTTMNNCLELFLHFILIYLNTKQRLFPVTDRLSSNHYVQEINQPNWSHFAFWNCDSNLDKCGHFLPLPPVAMGKLKRQTPFAFDTLHRNNHPQSGRLSRVVYFSRDGKLFNLETSPCRRWCERDRPASQRGWANINNKFICFDRASSKLEQCEAAGAKSIFVC